ncbi:FimV/HubP family polar landmark protein [Rhodoferax sediminis]|nr:FimV/HubP family polar landmark protein [Rhodoferax sediminis]
MRKSCGWQAGAIAAAIAVSFGLAATDAHALALGRLTVQSALGEPLRAEIDIPDINAEEAASLRATVASPDAFKAAGLEYNAAVSRLQISLQRRPDGRSYLSLRSDRAVNDPFIDVILEANWSTGRIVRDYTMLFDPNLTRQLAPVQPTAPQTSAAAMPPAPAMAAPSARRAPSRPAPAPRATSPAPSGAGNQVTVNRGDTAGRIAAANKPDNVSLDQMLVALLRTNPQAFIAGNVNRIKAGAVLTLPDAQQASATPAGEAQKTIIAQSRDFNEFRHKLAEGAPTMQMAAADRKAGGQLQANVEEKAPAATSPDKLTLSKGAVQGKAAEDSTLAARKARDAEARVAELSKNITELSKLEAASTAAGSAPALAASAATGGVAVAAGEASTAASAAAAATAASEAVAPVAAAASAAAAPAPAVVASAPAPAKVAPTPAPETSFMSELLDNPLAPVAAGGLIALLAGFGFYRARQRKKAGPVDSSFLESRLQPDSFFGSSGGQSVDTTKAAVPSSSMVYSASQLDAAGDVDPVAEADVYLAYGRDLQAEEILKEAIRTNPSRVAIHAKLLEIYAKRRDVKTFELVATEAYNLTAGESPEWEQICKLGQDLDPANPLYQPGGHPPAQDGAPAFGKAPVNDMVSTMPRTLQPALSQSPVPLDLDLDFSADDAPAPPTASRPGLGVDDVVPHMQPAEPTVTINAPTSASVPLDMDFSAATSGLQHSVAAADAAPVHDSGMIEFDMNSLSLSLDLDAAPADAALLASHESAHEPIHDPLATKLALAEEFRAIGDSDGARALAEEVIAQASGSLKARAQQLIAELR